MNLIKYDAARTALRQAVEIDDVKAIRDKAQAMAAYAHQAKNTELIEWATEIKVRAERRAGQMLAEMPKNEGAATRSLDGTASPKTLAEIGISKNQSSRWQKLAAVSDEQFEQAVTAAKEIAGEVTTAAMLRTEKANRPPAPPKPAPPKDTTKEATDSPEKPDEKYDPRDDQLSELRDLVRSLAEENESLKSEIKNRELPPSELEVKIKKLEIVIRSITKSRDQYMTENASMKTQMARQVREIKKLKK